MIKRNIFLFTLFIILARICHAEVTLPAMISDNMVIQQNSEIGIWGWAEPGEKISVKPSWVWFDKKTTANSNGDWSVNLKSPKAGEPLTIKITGSNTIKIKNIMAGEVWFCSGQSNMQMPLKGWDNSPILNGQQETENANYPSIRMFNVQCEYSEQAKNNCIGKWSVCTKQNAQWFSAVAYFFGRKLHKELNVPIGLINSSWGDTPIEAWIKRSAIKDNGKLSSILEKKHSKENQSPGVLYNSMVHPFINYKVNGFIWYQGENNRGRAEQYKTLFPLLINDWRKCWQQNDLPFYYAQLTGYYKHAPKEEVIFEKGQPGDSCWAELREAQLATLQTPNTGMAVTINVGSLNNIHPPDKQNVGKRLALWAMAKNYGLNSPYSGPLYKSFAVEGDKIRLFFDYADKLHFKHDDAEGFAICGKDNKFVWANAEIDKNSVIVYSKTIKAPVAVRYGWADYSTCNLYNQHGLPASPFRTDNLPTSGQCN